MMSWWTSAAPFSGKCQYIQPDGTRIEVWGEGDDFHAVFESLDGFTVVFDDARRAYCYARLSASGDELVSTGIQIQERRGEDLGLPRHLRLRSEIIRREVEGLRTRWNAEMGIQPLGLHRASSPSRGAGKLGLPHHPTLGTKVALCLLIDFDDDTATISRAEIDQFCNGASYAGYGNWGSVRQYYHYNSNGKLDYQNVVTAYIRIPNRIHPKSWYNDPGKGSGEQGNYLIRDAIDVLKSMPSFETEIKPALMGLTLNASGEVFACNVFYAGGHSGVWSRGLWPHSYSLAIVGAQELWPGGPKVNRYQVTHIGSELNLGTFCHESGHLVCRFPDIYDYGYDSTGGAGQFCMMNSGGFAKNPVQFCAYLKAAADWATLTDLLTTPSGVLTLSAEPGAGFNHFYYYQKPGVDTEYFLLECRNKSGLDSAIPASGIAIWHIDEWGNRDNQGLDFNLIHANYEVTLVQADNEWHFEQNLNSGDARDLFYLGNSASTYLNSFTDTTSPAARWWDGSSSGLKLANFSQPGPVMTVEYASTGVVANEAPFIVYQPGNQLVQQGTNFTLKVTALGAQPLSYQWFKNSVLLGGATASTHFVAAPELGDIGEYYVVVSNAYGAVTSLVARVSMVAEVARLPLGTYSYVADLTNNLAFVTGADGALAVVDLRTLSAPTLLAQPKIAGSTIGVAVSGRHAFVGAREQGFLVVDIANPREPRVVANCDTGGDTRGVILQGAYAYAADINSGLVVIDIADPLHPWIVGRRHITASKAERLTLWDHYIGLAGREGGLQIIDVSDPTNPLFVGGYDTDQITVEVTVADGLAYLADEKGGLKIVDVHNPAEPALIAQAPSQFSKCVAVSNQRAYIADYVEGLVVFDVAEARNPKRLGKIATYGNAEAVMISGDYVTIVDGGGGLLILRIFSNANESVLQFSQRPEGQTVFRGTDAVLQAKVIGTGPILYQWYYNGREIAGADSGVLVLPNVQSTEAGTYQLKVSNSTGTLLSPPILLGVVESQVRLALSGQAVGVAIHSNLVFVAVRSNGLAAVDIRNPEAPRLLGTLDTPRDALKVSVQGNYACVADRGGGLVVVNISDPTNMRQVGKLSSTGETMDVAMGGQYAYIADNWGGIFAVDLGDPAAPKRLGNGRTFSYANGLCYREGYVFVGDAGAGLRIYDVSKPLQIAFVGGCDTPGWSTGVSLKDGYAAVADQTGGLSFFNVSDPRSPRLVYRLGGSGIAQRVAYARGVAFVANTADNLWLVDFRNPSMPVTIGHLTTGGDTRDVAVDGDLVCAADANNGLVVAKVVFAQATPRILEPPASRLCASGENVTLRVTAEGEGSLRYQWYWNGSPIPGAINPTHAILAFEAGKQGSYCVEVADAFGSTRSSGADLVMATAPVILAQPIWGTAVAGLEISARVQAVGTGILQYQWFKDAQAYAGATNPTLVLSQARCADSGSYAVRVSNAYGSVDSQPLVLSVASDELDLLASVKLGDTAYAVTIVPGYAFVAAGTAGLRCLDISSPANAKVVGALDTPGYAKGICFDGHYVYIADGKETGTPGLRIVDVSIPAAPVLVGTLDNGGDASGVAVREGMAYVADGVRGLQIVDIRTPQSPRVLGVCDTPGQAVKVALSGSHAFVADRNSGVQILDISDPERPRIVGAYDTPGISVGVTVENNLLLVADESGGLLSFDITHPLKPILQSSLQSGFAKCAAVAGPFAFLGDWSKGLFMLNLSDPKLPWTMKNWRGGQGEGVMVAGNLICVADGSSGFSLFRADKLNGLQNHPPVVSPIDDQTVDVDNTLSLVLSATDLDTPTQPLAFRLGPGAPAGAAITLDGRFTWTPYAFQGGTTNLITIQVSDYWSTASQTLRVVVPGSPGPFMLPGTFAWYPLQGDAQDYGSAGRDGTYHSVTQTADRFGRAGTAAYLGGGGYITIPSFAWPSRTNISIAIWAKPALPNTGVFQDIISKHSGGGNVALLIRTGPDGKYYCQWDIGGKLYSTGSAAPRGDKFDLLVLTYDGSEIKFYVNTTLVSSQNATGNVVANNLPVTLGAKADALTSERFKGALDDLRFFDHALSTREMISLYEEPEPVNHRPVLLPLDNLTVSEGDSIRFNVSATDNDVPTQALVFTLDAGAPAGAAMTSDGLFTWTPTEAQGPGTNLLTVRVSDGMTNTSGAFQIVVREVNSPPVPARIGHQVVDEGALLSFIATAEDSDFPAQPLGFSLDDGAPPGAEISLDGLFTWIPTEAQGPGTNLVTVWVSDGVTNTSASFQIVVHEVNSPPVLTGMGPQVIDEGARLSFTATARDNDFPVQTLRFSLEEGAPAGAGISPDGLFSWTPAESQGPATHRCAIRVSDGMSIASETFQIVVNEVNTPPLLAAIGDQTIREGALLSITARAVDSDLPAQALTYRLADDAPSGASVGSTGLFTWTPTEVQGPSTNWLTLWVGDGFTNVSQTFQVVVLEADPVTIVRQPESQSVGVGADVTFSVMATGEAPIDYQWRFNETLLPGATSSVLVISNVQVTHGGRYDVIVSNAVNSVASGIAFLAVNRTFSGRGLDGYLADSTVFFDQNGDYALNDNEPFTQTDAHGHFDLMMNVSQFDLDRSGQLDPQEGRLLLLNGRDIATGLPLRTPLMAPVGSAVVHALTTLIQAVLDRNPGMPIQRAHDIVKTAMSITNEVSLMDYDPMAGALNNDAAAIPILKSIAEVQDTLVQVSMLVAAGAGHPGGAAVVTPVAVRILAADAQENGVLNLEDSERVAEFITRVVVATDGDLPDYVTDGAAVVVAGLNQLKARLVRESASSSVAARSLAQAQGVAQGAVAQFLQEAASGRQTIDDVVAGYIGEALKTAVSNAPVGDLSDSEIRPGTFGFSGDLFRGIENGNSVPGFELAISRRDGNKGEVTVNVVLSDGTATFNSEDYRSRQIEVVFGDREIRKIIPLNEVLYDDPLPEGEETVLLTLSLPAGVPDGAVLGGQTNAVLAIVDNDSPGTFAFSAGSYRVREDGTFEVPAAITRSGGSGGAVSVVVTPAEISGGAVAGIDFVAAPFEIRFNHNNLNRIFTLPVLADDIPESSEAFELVLSLKENAPEGAALGTPTRSTVMIEADREFDPQAILELVTKPQSGQWTLRVRGTATQKYELESSVDLEHWSTVQTGLLTETPSELTTPAADEACRFYRLRLVK
ncbi:MAG TPA: M6 family metalloprotease domain-containing protein [Candidatus Paceibacterota bacterium]|nr:M6 family metalloprotease domain-containing protein [Verrucomicrobiota bacterium]HRY46426.1 M6 family metalloprotease domain-containing protein [Candidatus Paceibacterota bacterium]